MKAVKTAISIFVALLGETLAQAPPPAPAVFTSPELGFRYTPPRGSANSTDVLSKIEASINTFELLKHD